MYVHCNRSLECSTETVDAHVISNYIARESLSLQYWTQVIDCSVHWVIGTRNPCRNRCNNWTKVHTGWDHAIEDTSVYGLVTVTFKEKILLTAVLNKINVQHVSLWKRRTGLYACQSPQYKHACRRGLLLHWFDKGDLIWADTEQNQITIEIETLSCTQLMKAYETETSCSLLWLILLSICTRSIHHYAFLGWPSKLRDNTAARSICMCNICLHTLICFWYGCNKLVESISCGFYCRVIRLSERLRNQKAALPRTHRLKDAMPCLAPCCRQYTPVMRTPLKVSRLLGCLHFRRKFTLLE